MRGLNVKSRNILVDRTDAIERYLLEIRRTPMIDEVELGKLIVNGDKEAKEQLINQNLKFVVSVAKQYGHFNVPLGDLISEGNIGLIKAADRFDFTKGYKFISYAVWWIRQRIMLCLEAQNNSVKLPTRLHQKVVGLKNSIMIKEQELGHDIGINIASHFVNDDEKDLVELMAYGYGTKDLSLDYVYGGDSDSNFSLKDHSIFSEDGIIQDRVEVNELKRIISYCLDKLNITDKTIVKRLYGIGCDPVPIVQVANDLGISPYNVQKYHDKTLKTIAKHMKGYNSLFDSHGVDSTMKEKAFRIEQEFIGSKEKVELTELENEMMVMFYQKKLPISKIAKIQCVSKLEILYAIKKYKIINKK